MGLDLAAACSEEAASEGSLRSCEKLDLLCGAVRGAVRPDLSPPVQDVWSLAGTQSCRLKKWPEWGSAP